MLIDIWLQWGFETLNKGSLDIFVSDVPEENEVNQIEDIMNPIRREYKIRHITLYAEFQPYSECYIRIRGWETLVWYPVCEVGPEGKGSYEYKENFSARVSVNVYKT